MSVQLPSLPYPREALEPHLSARTLEYHHGKHHLGYVEKANALLAGTDLAGKPPEVVLQAVAGEVSRRDLYNNLAQAWNHAFFWRCLKPGGGGAPAGRIAERLAADFGGFGRFAAAFLEAGTGLFGSGWVWLVERDGHLEIRPGVNADTPVAAGLRPLLVVDVWEHAYYLDYQNRRQDYLRAVLDHLLDWEFAAANLS